MRLEMEEYVEDKSAVPTKNHEVAVNGSVLDIIVPSLLT